MMIRPSIIKRSWILFFVFSLTFAGQVLAARLIEKESLNFRVDVSELLSGEKAQISMIYEGAAKFRGARHGFHLLDFLGLSHKKDRGGAEVMMFSSKLAFVVRGKTPDYFSLDLLSSPEFLEFVDPNVQATRLGVHQLLVTKEMFLVGTNRARVEFDYYARPQVGAWGPLYHDQELGTPMGLSVQKIHYIAPNGQETTMALVFNKYYSLRGGHTLVVSSQVSTLYTEGVPLPHFAIRKGVYYQFESEAQNLVQGMQTY